MNPKVFWSLLTFPLFVPLLRAIILFSSGDQLFRVLGEDLQILSLIPVTAYLFRFQYIVLNNKNSKYLLLFVLIGVLSSFFSEHPYTAFSGIAHIIIIILFGVALTNALRSDSSLAQNTLKLILITGLLYMVIFIPFYMTQRLNAEYPWAGGMLGFRNIRHFGMYLAIMAVVSLLFASQKKSLHILSILLSGTFLGFLFITGGRGGAMALLLAFTVWLAHGGRPYIRRAVSLGGLLALGVLIATIIPIENRAGLSRSIGAEIQSYQTLNQISSGRLHIWDVTLEEILEGPLLGSGTSTNPTFLDVYSTDHPHNIFLQILADWGLLGFLLIAIFIVPLLRRATKTVWTNRSGAVVTIAAALLVYIVVHALVSGALYIRYPLIIAVIALAILMSYNKPENNQQRPWLATLFTVTAAWVILINSLILTQNFSANPALVKQLALTPLSEREGAAPRWDVESIKRVNVTLSDAEIKQLAKHCSLTNCEQQIRVRLDLD